jgi:hypothetical protein
MSYVVKTGSQTLSTTDTTDDTLQITSTTSPDYSSGAQSTTSGTSFEFKILSLGDDPDDLQGLQIGLTTLSDIASVNMITSTNTPITLIMHSQSSTEDRLDNVNQPGSGTVAVNDVFEIAMDTSSGAVSIKKNTVTEFTGTSSQTGSSLYAYTVAKTTKNQKVQLIPGSTPPSTGGTRLPPPPIRLTL